VRNISRFPRLVRVATLAASVSALLSAGSAFATETLYGGGSTLAAPEYVGNGFNLTNPIARLSTDAGNTAGTGFTVAGITAGSFFAEYNTLDGAKISYCQTGSGFGKNALNGSVSAPASANCEDYSASAPVGFSAPTNSPDYIGTDSPYATTDYNNFLAGPNLATNQGIVQIPTIAGAIALPLNPSIKSAKLDTAQICKIYSGEYTLWSQVVGTTGTGDKSPIVIVYRTDSSGTSFNFTKYLANSCNGTVNVPTGFVFSPNQVFNSALPGGATAVYGLRSIGASGNPGVVQATVNTANGAALGYADTYEVVAEGANFALVNGFSPIKFGLSTTGVPTPLSITLGNLLTGKTLDGAVANPAPGNSSAAIKNCLRLVNPTLKFTTAYPIVAVTYLAGYYSGNGTVNGVSDPAHTTAIQDLYSLYYDHTNRPVLATGYAYLDGSAPFATSVKASIAACIKN
jgi:phosphate transport system substrate-binding protein